MSLPTGFYMSQVPNNFASFITFDYFHKISSNQIWVENIHYRRTKQHCLENTSPCLAEGKLCGKI